MNFSDFKLSVPFFLILVIFISGCTQISNLKKGAQNLWCLARGDIKCIRKEYNLTNNRGGGNHANRGKKRPYYRLDYQVNVNDVLIKGGRTRLEYTVENIGDIVGGKREGFTAKNVNLDILLYNDFTITRETNESMVNFCKDVDTGICTKQLEGRVKKEFHIPLGKISIGEVKNDMIKFNTADLDPRKTGSWIRNCTDIGPWVNCTLDYDYPAYFASQVNLTYNYATSSTLTYRVYGEDYYKNNIREIEAELKDYSVKENDNWIFKTTKDDRKKTPLILDLSTTSNRILKGQTFALKALAKLREKNTFFKPFPGKFLAKYSGKNVHSLSECRMITPQNRWYKSSEEAKWYCKIRAPSSGSNFGSTFHYIVALPYKVRFVETHDKEFTIEEPQVQ